MYELQGTKQSRWKNVWRSFVKSQASERLGSGFEWQEVVGSTSMKYPCLSCLQFPCLFCSRLRFPWGCGPDILDLNPAPGGMKTETFACRSPWRLSKDLPKQLGSRQTSWWAPIRSWKVPSCPRNECPVPQSLSVSCYFLLTFLEGQENPSPLPNEG